ncbi:class I lanthipeptide [Parapedobacter tibetensis]|uniref:class I lanthipeptide n=1 Tax=Parapedobacter tibetensis TaxID=2972951 RepID=UPI00214D9EE9|nr:class I lanthipeptide [Parapedobacter tibetensis]
MKKLKKLSLDKEKIVNLNEQGMSELKGGSISAISRFITHYSAGKSLDYTTSVVESWMKDNTLWVGCTTDPKYSEMYGTTPGCIEP